MSDRPTGGWLEINHVQLAIPPGSEDMCRAFYVGILGMTEVPKPENLRTRGGLWLRTGQIEIHLGVEQDFRPARKAHPGMTVKDIDAMASHLAANGVEVLWDHELPTHRRFYVNDSVGNRLEIMSAPPCGLRG
jgi:catechol 2,3-dioxygenase-like lactoylglutathione lyase family enzyme